MSDMWLPPEDDPRETGVVAVGEKAIVLDYLDRYRTTFRLKCEGLDAEQLARRSVPPSSMSLLGLLRHLAQVEQTWSRRVLEGHGDALVSHFKRPDDPDWDFHGALADDAVVAEAWQTWEAEVEHARQVEASVEMGTVVDVRGQPCEVRDVLVHLVEEYARHCGHADLLRECVDGRTGQ